MPEQLIAADLLWTPRGLERDLALEISADGRIQDIAPLGQRTATRVLRGCALLPGFVNAHSHAFQRGLRGRGESFPAGAGSFWSWREAMYQLVAELDVDGIHRLCHQAFSEMLDAGITTVGEFHYLHHLGAPADSVGEFAADRVVLEAAHDTGIRLVLLEAFYARGGFDGRPLAGGQRRFETSSLDGYWRQLDSLATKLRGPQSLGVVAHSLRAVALGELRELWRGACERDLVLHLHLEEQRLEIEDSLAVHGARPMALLLENLFADDASAGHRLTAVHCTHSIPQELAPLIQAGAHLCICPLTEANLGDGIADLPSMLELGASLSLGSDSNARISMLEEMRWLEYAQRLARERRGVILDAEGRSARRLFEIATAGGAASLGLDAGRLEVGRAADLIAIDLSHPSLADVVSSASGAEVTDHAAAEQLEAALVFGAADAVINAVAVGGRWLRGH